MKLDRILFTLIPAFCCAVIAHAELETPPERLSRIDKFVWEALPFLKSANPTDIKSLGRVAKYASRVEASPHGEGSITYRTYWLKGLEIQQRSFGSPIQHQLVSVKVLSPRWAVKENLVVGASVIRVLEVLGQPSERKKENLLYRGESEQVEFLTKSGLIERIDFFYYAD